MIDTQYVERFEQEGYVVVPSVFPLAEVEAIKAHFMRLHARKIGFHDDGISDEHDPLFRYPRMIHPHRYDGLSRDWLLDPRLRALTTALLGREPLAAQTMFYFKPPGARGQALHQDQRSLEVRPGTCLAAWMAVDACDEDNGCMKIVPQHPGPGQTLSDRCGPAQVLQRHHHRAGRLDGTAAPCPCSRVTYSSSTARSSMAAGPTRPANRFRRAMIAHYVVGEAEKVAQFYQPLLTFDGAELEIGVSDKGGPCGIWVPASRQRCGPRGTGARRAAPKVIRYGSTTQFMEVSSMQCISLDHVTLSYAAREIFADLAWGIDSRARSGLIGPNGVGKSSLLRIISGALTPDSGLVQRLPGTRVGYLPQQVTLPAGPQPVADGAGVAARAGGRRAAPDPAGATPRRNGGLQ